MFSFHKLLLTNLVFFSHYLETSHCYSMNLGNNRVWDYVGDNFVHRLVQNKGDGKLVEGSSPGKLDVKFVFTILYYLICVIV